MSFKTLYNFTQILTCEGDIPFLIYKMDKQPKDTTWIIQGHAASEGRTELSRSGLKSTPPSPCDRHVKALPQSGTLGSV